MVGSDAASLSDTASSLTSEDHDSQYNAASPMLSLNHLLSSSCGSSNHSLMAAHDDDTVCKDDLQALFELAQTLFGQGTPPHDAIASDKQQGHCMVSVILQVCEYVME